MKLKLSNFKVACATHSLALYARNASYGYTYLIPCIPIKKTKQGNLKVVAFGYMRAMHNSKPRVMYVDPNRVQKKLTGEQNA